MLSVRLQDIDASEWRLFEATIRKVALTDPEATEHGVIVELLIPAPRPDALTHLLERIDHFAMLDAQDNMSVRAAKGATT